MTNKAPVLKSRENSTDTPPLDPCSLMYIRLGERLITVLREKLENSVWLCAFLYLKEVAKVIFEPIDAD